MSASDLSTGCALEEALLALCLSSMYSHHFLTPVPTKSAMQSRSLIVICILYMYGMVTAFKSCLLLYDIHHTCILYCLPCCS